MSSLIVKELDKSHVDKIVDVFCDAFYDYPVMRHVVGPAVEDYDQCLHTLIEFFVMARVYHQGPLLGVLDENTLIAAATMSRPDESSAPPELLEHRERVWHNLGVDARKRYESFGKAWSETPIIQPHLHLNMIGVRREHHGKGLARMLLDAVHEKSEEHPNSTGVSLSTENQKNVSLYEYFGYEITGQAKIAPGVETWSFFRKNLE